MTHNSLIDLYKMIFFSFQLTKVAFVDLIEQDLQDLKSEREQ